MGKENRLDRALGRLSNDIRAFIDLSIKEPEPVWQEWLAAILKENRVVSQCWEKKGCGKSDCPAFMNDCGRCWLIAGTMCYGEPQGKFARKYTSCTQCEVYQNAVFKDPVTEIYEHLITLVHSLRTKNEEIKTLAVTDRLTGLKNRHYFDLIIQHKIGEINRYGGEFLVLIADVDGFKKINDTYGHLHGDGVLRECASILAKSIRISDILIRFGGDEFLIITPAEDCQTAKALTDRIRKNLDLWNAEYAALDYRLSLSIGCALFEKGNNIAKVIEDADAEMYRNKNKRHMEK